MRERERDSGDYSEVHPHVTKPKSAVQTTSLALSHILRPASPAFFFPSLHLYFIPPSLSSLIPFAQTPPLTERRLGLLPFQCEQIRR